MELDGHDGEGGEESEDRGGDWCALEPACFGGTAIDDSTVRSGALHSSAPLLSVSSRPMSWSQARTASVVVLVEVFGKARGV